jgi:hypothetical protein
MSFINRVDHDSMKKFLDLGAVKAGCTLFTRRDWLRGYDVEEPDTSIIYFFDKEGREIGYWTMVSPIFTVILAPNYREWSDEFLSKMQWESLVVAG